MTLRLTEDDLYRTSTQYRLWSFAPEKLAAQRRQTHELGLTRAQQQHAQAQNRTDASDIEYLTEEEELRLVGKNCEIIAATCNHLGWPINVKATAIQYLKRFYLSNSCITYPPKEIYKTILFMATKTEAIHLTAPKFAKSINADTDAILAPEYKVMQALRFTLDIRHPIRGLRGVLMELLNMAQGRIGKNNGLEQKSGKEVRDRLLVLKAPSPNCRTSWKHPSGPIDEKQLIERIDAACAEKQTVEDLLLGPALITDAYFLYTPSQILFAALQVADEPLASFYLDMKLPLSSAARPKILATINDCAQMLSAYDSKTSMTKAERDALEAKLDKCRDPTTKDLVKSHAAMKRNGAAEGTVDEQETKRRKLERENSSRDDVFGPALHAKTNGNG